MRPDPQRPEQDDSGRIIYLGDVRRRRGLRPPTPDRAYLVILAAVALVSWLIWLGVVLTVAPLRLLTYLAFFLPLGIALAATASLGFYGIEWQRGLLPNVHRAIRRGVLLAAVVVVNLAVLPAHQWNVLVGVVSVTVALLVDAGWGYRARRR